MGTYQVNADGNAPKGLKQGDYVVTEAGTYKVDGYNADGSYKSSWANSTTTKNYEGKYDTPTGTGKYYRVQDNGKAPSDLLPGDNVVTANGTYQIGGYNADGSYKSDKVSDVNTENFTGTYATQKGVPSLEDYLAGITVPDYTAHLKEGMDALKKNAENTKRQLLNDILLRREQTEKDLDAQAREAYINSVIGQDRLLKSLKSAGLGTQGVTETTLAGNQAAYENNANDIALKRLELLAALDSEKTNAKLNYENTLNNLQYQYTQDMANAKGQQYETLLNLALAKYNDARNKEQTEHERYREQMYDAISGAQYNENRADVLAQREQEENYRKAQILLEKLGYADDWLAEYLGVPKSVLEGYVAEQKGRSSVNPLNPEPYDESAARVQAFVNSVAGQTKEQQLMAVINSGLSEEEQEAAISALGITDKDITSIYTKNLITQPDGIYRKITYPGK